MKEGYNKISIGKNNLVKEYKIKIAIILAVIIGLLAQVLSYIFDLNYAYRDSIFKIEAARRFTDYLNPGFFNQIGTVWLPIPNILLMPFAAIDFLFENGLAASVLYYPFFVISSIFIFLSLKELTNDVTSSWIGFML